MTAMPKTNQTSSKHVRSRHGNMKKVPKKTKQAFESHASAGDIHLVVESLKMLIWVAVFIISHMTTIKLLTAKAIAHRLVPGQYGRPIRAISKPVSLSVVLPAQTPLTLKPINPELCTTRGKACFSHFVVPFYEKTYISLS